VLNDSSVCNLGSPVSLIESPLVIHELTKDRDCICKYFYVGHLDVTKTPGTQGRVGGGVLPGCSPPRSPKTKILNTQVLQIL
jgi:hypothetical protein